MERYERSSNHRERYTAYSGKKNQYLNDVNSLIMLSQYYAMHGPLSGSLHYKQPMRQTLTLLHFIFN